MREGKKKKKANRARVREEEEESGGGGAKLEQKLEPAPSTDGRTDGQTDRAASKFLLETRCFALEMKMTCERRRPAGR